MSGSGPMLKSPAPTLTDLQAPVAEDLEKVMGELRRIIVSNFDMIAEINEYLTLLRGKLFRPARLAVEKSKVYAYRDRRNRKREFHRLWITRINAAARLHGISYS